MTKVTVDPELREKLGDLKDFVEFRDEHGRVVGFFHPAARISETDDRQAGSPISDEEIEACRQQRTGRPLAEIIADLDQQG